MRCAIVHYWLLGMRGGEKVVEALCRLLPDADLFTLFYAPSRISPIIRAHRVHASCLNRWQRYYRSLLPFMPMVLETFDLREYDLVISSESGPAKGIIASTETRHICYCHSPMRYVWDLYPDYLHEWATSRVKRAVLIPVTNYMRLWDYASAARVDEFIANSGNVQKRIWKRYGRTAEIIYPPVPVEEFYHAAAEDYYLVVSELVAYKRILDAVLVCTKTGRRLKVVGDGPEYKALARIAGSTVEFCGRVPDDALRYLYSRCRALIVPGEEDFGITAVEALASGKPIVALGRGGVREIAPEENPRAGYFYAEPGPEALLAALNGFEKCEGTVSPAALAACAERFSDRKFATAMLGVLSRSRSQPSPSPFQYEHSVL